MDIGAYASVLFLVLSLFRPRVFVFESNRFNKLSIAPLFIAFIRLPRSFRVAISRSAHLELYPFMNRVLGAGVEPAHLAALEPKSGVSAIPPPEQNL